MTRILYCPYCDDGPKEEGDLACCGESAAHFVEYPELSKQAKAAAPELFGRLKRLVIAATGPASVLHLQLMMAERLISKIEGLKR